MYDIPIFIVEAKRSQLRQSELHRNGYSQIASGGPHQKGMALDIVHSVKLWDGMEKQDWDLLFEIGSDVATRRGLKLEWGGHWSFYDPAHWQIADWRNKEPRL